MLEVVYYVAASLDGYIATDDGGVDWLAPFQSAKEDHGTGDLYSSVDALLMGSHTYEFALELGQWPSPDKPSWVFTRRDLRLLSSQHYPHLTKSRGGRRTAAGSRPAPSMAHGWR